MARTATTNDLIELHRSRWQMLVNAVADRWNGGLVPGTDRQAIKWALETIRKAPPDDSPTGT